MRVSAYSPHSADTAGGKSPGRDGGSLLHEASNWEPEAVAERVLVNEQIAASLEIRVGVVPLVRRQSGGDERTERITDGDKKTNVVKQWPKGKCFLNGANLERQL